MPELPIDHAGLETLSFERCLDLLGSVPLGRVGFFADGEVVILPVNHAMDGPDVVFRTAPGSLLTTAGEQGPVTFEADQFDAGTRTGWSVLVTGRATTVYDETEVRHLNRLGLEPWPSVIEHGFWIRIRPTSVTGRRTNPWAARMRLTSHVSLSGCPGTRLPAAAQRGIHSAR